MSVALLMWTARAAMHALCVCQTSVILHWTLILYTEPRYCMGILFDQKLEWAVACRLMSIPNIEFRLPGSVLATAVSFHAMASRRDRVRVGEEVVLLSPVS